MLSIKKIFEKSMYERLLNFINSCDLLTKHQFGFRKGKTTADAIFEVTQFASTCVQYKLCNVYFS